MPSDKSLLPTSKAAEGVERIAEFYKIESEIADLSSEERMKARQERIKPLLDDFFALAEKTRPSGGTGLAKAVRYVVNEKKYLYAFLNDPDIPIDNNRAENSICPFVVGRKNWLFSNTAGGAKASAIIYSLAVSASANGLNVEEYFRKVLSEGKAILPWKAE